MEDFEEQKTSCRMFRNEYPNIDDYVMCKVTNMDDDGADVELLEYNNLNGYMSISQFTRKRVRSIKKIVNVGQEHALQVIGVDTEKGYVDLSKKNVSEEDSDSCKERYVQERKTHNILTRIAQVNETSLFDVYDKCGWQLCDHFHKNMYEVFELMSDIGGNVFSSCECDVSDKIQSDLVELVQKTFVKTERRFEKPFQLMSTAENGVEIIKECLMSLEGNEDVHVELIGSPNYKVVVMAFGEKKAEERLEAALDQIKNFAEKYKDTTQIEWK